MTEDVIRELNELRKDSPRWSFIDGPITSGVLESVLEDWEFQPGTSVFAVYPHRHHVQNKVRLFVDQLQRAFNPPPWRA